MALATVAVVPARRDPRRLLDLILPDVDQAIVIDLGVGPVDDPKVSTILGDPRASVYAAWNLGWRAAVELGASSVAFVDPGVSVHPGTIAFLARALRVRGDVGVVYPDERVRLSRPLPARVSIDIERDPLGGREMTGFCFLVRGDLELREPFDEGYRAVYGDTQFDEAVRLLGYGVARVNRVPVECVPDALRVSESIVDADGRRYDSLHVRVIDGRWWPVSERYG